MTEITIACTEDIEEALNRASDASAKLGQKLFWLDIVLAAATTFGIILFRKGI